MLGPSRHPEDAKDYKTNATPTTYVDAPMEASEPKPERHGHRWNLEEDQRLLHAFQSDKPDVRSPFRVTLGDHSRLLSCDYFMWMRPRSYPCGDHSLFQWPDKVNIGAKLGRSAEADRALVRQSLTRAIACLGSQGVTIPSPGAPSMAKAVKACSVLQSFDINGYVIV